MLERLAAGIVARWRLVLVVAAVVAVAAAVSGNGVVRKLTVGGTSDPRSTSSRAEALIAARAPGADPNVMVTVTSRTSTVDSTAVAAAGEKLEHRLSALPGITGVVSYWSLGRPVPLRSRDAHSALILATATGSPDAAQRIAGRVVATLGTARDGLVLHAGGSAVVSHAINVQVDRDLHLAEALAFPVTVLLLLLVFGAVVAAATPLCIAVFSILGTLAVLRLLASQTDVSIFALNLTTALGLALSIDYSLLLVGRFREELHAGLDPHDAVVRAVGTAGRTIVVSALTVAGSLSAMLLFPLAFLRSFAYAGVAVVVLSAIGAVVVLPAVLMGVGRNINRGRVFHRHPGTSDTGRWSRLAEGVMRRPWPVVTAVIAVLVVLGLPFLHARFGLVDDRVLPSSSAARAAENVVRHDFSGRETSPLVVTTSSHSPIGAASWDEYAARVSALPGVARVDALDGSWVGGVRVADATLASARFAGPGAWLSAVASVEPLSAAGERLVHDLRALTGPAPVLVGGRSADLVDAKRSVFSHLPLALSVIGLVTFVVLFLLFRSLLIPAKAVVLNVLSLTATFGALVFVFQEGHAAHLLSFTSTGTLDTPIPVLMFCIAFGLSMDYEVFLLSRIQEQYLATGDNRKAIATGLQHTGGIVTAAAGLLSVVFIAFATSGVTIMKMIGLGLALAVLMDATLVRCTLVPALMRLAGDANWWLPRPLRWVHDRVGVSSPEGVAAAPTASPVTVDAR